MYAGYEFKKGPKGVGYYLTVLPTVTFDPRNHKQQQKQKQAKREAGPGGYVNGPGGLKYREMVPGRGAQPKRGQNVKCKYVLRLNGPTGRVVDKSGPRGFVSCTHVHKLHGRTCARLHTRVVLRESCAD